MGGASPGARVLERDGVVAAIVPAAPERSVPNSVVYENAERLAGAYDELAAAYREIGARWTVWVHPGDEEAAALLERAGHVLDAEPDAMALDLGETVERPLPAALGDWTAEGDVTDVGPLNDRAYSHGTNSFTRALSHLRREELRVYVARAEDVPVGCAMVADHGSNTSVEMVAVVPEARGRGLSGKLLAHALADAAERGIDSSTLIASPLGRPVYERLGFRRLGNVSMWERPADRG